MVFGLCYHSLDIRVTNKTFNNRLQGTKKMSPGPGVRVPYLNQVCLAGDLPLDGVPSAAVKVLDGSRRAACGPRQEPHWIDENTEKVQI